MSVQVQTKAVVSVAEMARMCGLSRARFYQLVNEGVFPPPLYRIDTKRPFFDQEMQESASKCDGEIAASMEGRCCSTLGDCEHQSPKSKTTPPKNSHKHADLVEGLRALGLTIVSSAEVEAAIQQMLPKW